jgi:hypothetical protein
MNVQMRVQILISFITHLLVHMHQKTKIALEIAAKIASVNGPLRNCQLNMLIIVQPLLIDCPPPSPRYA